MAAIPDSKPFVDLLRSQILNSQVLFFFAAGASMNWGYPSASALTQLILEETRRQIDKDEGFANRVRAGATDSVLLHIFAADVVASLMAEVPTESKLSDAEKEKVADRFRESWEASGRAGPVKYADIESELKNQLMLGDLTDGLNLGKSDLLCRLWVELQNNGRPLWPSWEQETTGDPVSGGVVGIPYLVIGRLAKEGFLREVMTLNYDHLLELGCWAVGMVRAYPPGSTQDSLGPRELEGIPKESRLTGWPEVFRVIADHHEQTMPYPDRLAFRIIKLHGCADTAKVRVKATETEAEEDRKVHLSQRYLNQVITRNELLTWRHDSWARDLFVDRVRSHHVVFVGFGGADPVLHATLRDTFTEALGTDDPRSNPNGNRHKIRAQAVDIHNWVTNANLSQILRAARSQDKQPPEQLCGLPQGKVEAKHAIEQVFRNLYVQVVHESIKSRIVSTGPGLLTDWVAEPAKQNTEWQHLVEWLDELHEDSSLESDFLYHALPGALRWSWMMRAPEVVRPHGVETERYGRPHYYVPLQHNFAWVVTLLAAYKVVAAGHLGEVRFEEDGWMEWQPDFRERWGTLRILPLLMPRPANLARLAAFRHLTTGNRTSRHRQPAARTVFLSLAAKAAKNEWRRDPMPWTEVSTGMGTIRANVLSVPITELWSDPKKLLRQLNALARGG